MLALDGFEEPIFSINKPVVTPNFDISNIGPFKALGTQTFGHLYQHHMPMRVEFPLGLSTSQMVLPPKEYLQVVCILHSVTEVYGDSHKFYKILS